MEALSAIHASFTDVFLVLSEMAGVPVDVIHPVYVGYDTMPEQTLNDAQRAVIAVAKAEFGL